MFRKVQKLSVVKKMAEADSRVARVHSLIGSRQAGTTKETAS
jgi:hypothetical protein